MVLQGLCGRRGVTLGRSGAGVGYGETLCPSSCFPPDGEPHPLCGHSPGSHLIGNAPAIACLPETEPELVLSRACPPGPKSWTKIHPPRLERWKHGHRSR